MKKKIIITVIIAFYIIKSFAQTYTTIYTKGGQAINVTIYENDLEDDYIQEMNEECRTMFPNATFLNDASIKYNCHSFAWNISDGGSIVCWMKQKTDGKPNISKYWTDDYYSETTEQNAVKVFYYNSDHSAIVSPTVKGMYESKWGSWPLMRHAPNYGPYDKMNERKYYCHIVPEVIYGRINCDDVTIKNTSSYYMATINYSNNIRMEYTILNPKGDDAVEDGRAIINETLGNGLNITFTKTGIYEIYLYFYNKFNELIGEFSGDTFVIDRR